MIEGLSDKTLSFVPFKSMQQNLIVLITRYPFVLN